MSVLKNLPDHLQVIKNRLLSCSSDCRGGDGCKGQQRKKGAAGIPVTRKMCYAVGGVPYQMTAVAMGISLQIFLLDVVQMEAFYVSMILFVSRAWDAVTDPLIGYLVSRSRWTPIGKLMPWVVLSMPFGVLSYVLLWFTPQGSVSQAFSVPWFLATACLFETLMSCYNVPYLSLNMFLGGDQRDRDSATAYRMSVEMLAMLVASVIQGQVVAVYNTEREGACQQLALDVPGNTPSPHTASLQGTRKAFLISALVMGAMFFLCCLVLFLGVKEQQAPSGCQEKVQVSYFTSLKMLACHVPYQRLVLGFVFSALAFQMSLGNFVLFCSHAAGHGAQFQHLLLVLLAAATIAVPLWQAVLVRIGKKTTVFIGLSLFIPAVIVIACVPSSLPVFMTMCVLMGFSLATMFLLPWSMLPDVVDDFAVRNPGCGGLEPLFFSCYAFCNKLAGGLSVGISTMTLHFVGYRAGACSHDESVVTALIVLFSPVPITLLLVGLAFFRFYPIDEERRAHIQTLLTRVHGDVPSSDRGDDLQQLAGLQQQQPPQSTVKTSFKWRPAIKPGALHKSTSLPPCHDHRKSSVKSNNVSNNNKSKSLSVGNIRPVPAGRSSSRPPRHKGRLHQHSSKVKQSDGCPEYDHGSLSGSMMSYGRSTVTWV